MSSKLYDLMNWRNIEGVLYADLDKPNVVLGTQNLVNEKLVQVFQPHAMSVEIIFDNSGRSYKAEEVDDSFFSVMIPKKETGLYQVKAIYGEDREYQYYDPYQFHDILPKNELKKFNAGTNYGIYDYLGAHKDTIKGVEGIRFGVWAPFAKRVSVVGDFNFWDGRRHMMNRVDDTGVFEIFIPGLVDGELYKYEIKKSDGSNVLKADPYAFATQKRPDNASVIFDIDNFKWNDDNWIKSRKESHGINKPTSIYEVHLGSWKKPVIEGIEEKESFYTYKEIAPLLAQYVKEMKYTHIELLPVMEHPLDASWGYQVTGYYAPTSRYGTPEDFMYFVEYMHKENIGVIIDWVPAHFPKDEFGLAKFDGSCLYEHMDPRQGEHPHWGTLIYNYGRPEVRDFLISNAIFWMEKYHVDGIRIDAVASMLYLDYGKEHGEWVANIYGGNENLEAIEFIKDLNTQIKKKDKSVAVIAEESTAWPLVSESVKDGGLGFDYKWNMGWMNDFTSYMQCDPYYRKNNYHQLTFSMIYNYSEKFVLVLSHDEVVHGKRSMISKMPGDESERFSNLRAAYALMMTHPGKKLMFMGQEFAHYREWSEERQLDWDSLLDDKHKEMQNTVKELNELYIGEPALYEQDYSTAGFEWINDMEQEKSICSFVRKGKKAQDLLLVVCNFDTISYEEYKVGVPKAGKYKEIFNSDRKELGGNDFVNKRVKTSTKEGCDGRQNSISIKLAPLSVTVLKYTAVKSPVAKKMEQQYIEEELKVEKKTEVKATPKVAPKTESMAENKPTVKTETKVEKQPAVKVETKVEKQSAVKVETKVEKKPAVKTETKVDKKPAVKVETKVEKKPAVKVETKVEKKPTVKTETKVEKKPTVKAETKVEKQPAVKVETKIEKQPAVKAETKVEKQPVVKVETKAEKQPSVKTNPKVEKKPSMKNNRRK